MTEFINENPWLWWAFCVGISVAIHRVIKEDGDGFFILVGGPIYTVYIITVSLVSSSLNSLAKRHGNKQLKKEVKTLKNQITDLEWKNQQLQSDLEEAYRAGGNA